MKTRRNKIASLLVAASAAAAKPRSKWLPRRSLPSSASSPADSNKFVFLHQWWLVKVNAKDLAVGGFADKDQRVSLFQSAAIAKRHNATVLETSDGMMVVLNGVIDRLRTNENGFPNEFCHRFMLGFPLDWERLQDQYLSGSFTSSERVLHSGDFPSNASSVSLDNVPAARIRDLTFGLGESDSDLFMRNICDDILKTLGKAPQSEQEGALGLNQDKEFEKAAAGEARDNCESPSRNEHTGTHRKEASATESRAKRIRRGGKESSRAGGAIGGVSTRRMSRVSTRSMTRLMRCGP